MAAIIGLAFAIIPYMIAKCLAEMVAIRQRHLLMEQQVRQNYLLGQQLQQASNPSSQAAPQRKAVPNTAPNMEMPQ
jgi:hypothetical protein